MAKWEFVRTWFLHASVIWCRTSSSKIPACAQSPGVNVKANCHSRPFAPKGMAVRKAGAEMLLKAHLYGLVLSWLVRFEMGWVANRSCESHHLVSKLADGLPNRLVCESSLNIWVLITYTSFHTAYHVKLLSSWDRGHVSSKLFKSTPVCATPSCAN